MLPNLLANDELIRKTVASGGMCEGRENVEKRLIDLWKKSRERIRTKFDVRTKIRIGENTRYVA